MVGWRVPVPAHLPSAQPRTRPTVHPLEANGLFSGRFAQRGERCGVARLECIERDGGQLAIPHLVGDHVRVARIKVAVAAHLTAGESAAGAHIDKLEADGLV